MCLLDAVLIWDDQSIRCSATSHRDPGNPLRAEGRLAAVCGIEYAAQAMALHGALLAPTDVAKPRAGYLASVRGVTLAVATLDGLPAPLEVEAERLSGTDTSILYAFRLACAGRELLTGRASVILDADAVHRS